MKHCINSEIFKQLEVVTVFFGNERRKRQILKMLVLVVTITILFIGANDAVVPNLIDRFSRQHVPVEEYKQNLIDIANYFKNLQNRDGTSPVRINYFDLFVLNIIFLFSIIFYF
jgi:hypothetical protein